MDSEDEDGGSNEEGDVEMEDSGSEDPSDAAMKDDESGDDDSSESSSSDEDMPRKGPKMLPTANEKFFADL
jgi:hypothetical protein